MKFAQSVVSFEFAGISLVGCLSTGYVIGLTPQGASVCSRMFEEDVCEDEIHAVDARLLEHLTKGGFFSDATPVDQVVCAYLHVTQRCNLTCKGCYSLDDQRNCLPDAPLSHLCHALDELAAAGVSRLVISGGEPFMRADLPDIVQYAKETAKIASVTVLSNGLCLTQEALKRLAPFVDCVSISFDGCSADSSAYIRSEQRFDELVAAVKMVQAAGIAAHIIPTIHARNIEDTYRYVTLSQELGASLNFSLLSCEPADAVLGALMPKDQELRYLGESLLTLGEGVPSLAMDSPVSMSLSVRSGCGAGYRELSIGADGTIYPCHMLQRAEFAMGNAFEGSIKQALAGSVSQKFRALDASKFDDCQDCRYLHFCAGGCRARALYESGNLESRDSYCIMTQTFYDALSQKMSASMKQRR